MSNSRLPAIVMDLSPSRPCSLEGVLPDPAAAASRRVARDGGAGEVTRMWSLSRPTPDEVRRHLERQRGLPFSYGAVGETHTGGAPAGFDRDHNRERLGTGG